ncbi:DUF1816 domain-containing protein [Acaryochloris sp. IP29b_bin.148]|uniref:DUF1816 domain-containing protein n=1 Tax=Acaryochloris sp. IP29b_bin.148 TaxID=2969218 RepID=UPI00263865C1|nr:DUF1816 domain-containing protein [Acaryochloris sp. IP29b_bin.148]
MSSFRNAFMYWWVHIQTTIPECQYYFGPFTSVEEAEAYQSGYVEDLVRENALEIIVKITRCQPETLTLYEEEESYMSEMIGTLPTLSLHEQPTVLSRC